MVKHKLNMYVWVLGITTISLLSVSDTAVAEEGRDPHPSSAGGGGHIGGAFSDGTGGTCESAGDTGQWTCPGTEESISCDYVCDGFEPADCADGSDEDTDFCEVFGDNYDPSRDPKKEAMAENLDGRDEAEDERDTPSQRDPTPPPDTDFGTRYIETQSVTIHSLVHKSRSTKGDTELINLAEIRAFDDTDTEIDPITATFASDDTAARRGGAQSSPLLRAAYCIDGHDDTVCVSKGSNPALTITYPDSPVIHHVTVHLKNHFSELLRARIDGAQLTIRNAKGVRVSTGVFFDESTVDDTDNPDYYTFLADDTGALAGRLTAGYDDGYDDGYGIDVPGVLLPTSGLDAIEIAATTARASSSSSNSADTPGNCNNAAPPPTNADLTTANANLSIGLAVVSTLLAVAILLLLRAQPTPAPGGGNTGMEAAPRAGGEAPHADRRRSSFGDSTWSSFGDPRTAPDLRQASELSTSQV